MRPALTRRLLSRSNPLNSHPIRAMRFSVVAQIHQLPAGVTLGCQYIISINV